MMQLAKRNKYHPESSWLSIRVFIGAGLVIFLLSACTDKKQESLYTDITEKLILKCDANCDQVANKVTALNGTVTYSYQNISALAVTVPIANVNKLKQLAGVNSVKKDNLIPRPKVPKTFIKDRNNVIYSSRSNVAANNFKTEALDIKALIATNPIKPNNYIYNNIINGVAKLHLQDITGKGVVVAIIDSGTANNSDTVPALAGSVIGGENLVDLIDEPSATSTLNDDHGTMVGSMIAAHLSMIMPNTSPFIRSVSIHAPQSVFPVDADNSLVPMLGTAPDASLYPLKVFSAVGDGGAPNSVIIAAMDRALTLKKNYDMGMNTDAVAGDGSEDNPYIYDALNIQVVNMSLGGITLFPGNDVEDLLVIEMLKNGITVVTSAGNEGFGAMTGGSPGTSTGTISVGAANSPVHERILRDMQDQVGAGIEFRPNDIMQTAFFSSRGPTADGRVGVDLVANGFAAFTQAADGSIAFVSGTSFSSPTVAGAAALLWSATNEQEQEVSAAHIRAALIKSANPDMLDNEGDLPIDRGNGYLDAAAAL
ncbi:MAG: S8 family serine peptidase, partial [Thiohalomonadales bacterium]